MGLYFSWDKKRGWPVRLVAETSHMLFSCNATCGCSDLGGSTQDRFIRLSRTPAIHHLPKRRSLQAAAWCLCRISRNQRPTKHTKGRLVCVVISNSLPLSTAQRDGTYNRANCLSFKSSPSQMRERSSLYDRTSLLRSGNSSHQEAKWGEKFLEIIDNGVRTN